MSHLRSSNDILFKVARTRPCGVALDNLRCFFLFTNAVKNISNAFGIPIPIIVIKIRTIFHAMARSRIFGVRADAPLHFLTSQCALTDWDQSLNHLRDYIYMINIADRVVSKSSERSLNPRVLDH